MCLYSARGDSEASARRQQGAGQRMRVLVPRAATFAPRDRRARPIHALEHKHSYLIIKNQIASDSESLKTVDLQTQSPMGSEQEGNESGCVC
ncbi:hypothetical protein HF086_015948 [Spodoptera exigua]|uniref:Uncharacterized protein n=1 Tax=Spodoptera exigua TaxID=7107 RepID=A0A922M1W3_SPOEX|nr:hypothetical protein HF086_015948 [Spodoptera exigua]